jgi:hypothetical protein
MYGTGAFTFIDRGSASYSNELADDTGTFALAGSDFASMGTWLFVLGISLPML